MKNSKLFIFLFIFLLFSFQIKAQDSTALSLFKNLELHGFVETYYNINTDKNNSLKLFPCISPYRNQFRLNIAQISLKYTSDKIRSTFTIHYGDIPDINWEPSTQFKYIQEANIGFTPLKNLWIDAGFFQTHLGAEGFPPNNFLSSNALISIAEPNFQGGVKISYEFTKKFNAAFHLINGANLFEDNNKNKSFGIQLNYSPNDNLQFSYNNLFGNEK